MVVFFFPFFGLYFGANSFSYLFTISFIICGIINMIMVSLEILEIKVNFNLQLFVLLMTDSEFGNFMTIWIH